MGAQCHILLWFLVIQSIYLTLIGVEICLQIYINPMDAKKQAVKRTNKAMRKK
jgi:hypothetical protein